MNKINMCAEGNELVIRIPFQLGEKIDVGPCTGSSQTATVDCKFLNIVVNNLIGFNPITNEANVGINVYVHENV